MPFRLDEFRAKIQFVTSAEMPSLIYKAVVSTGMRSNTQYIQHAVCEALARDLGIPLNRLIDGLPEPRSNAAIPWGPDRRQRPGSARTVEEVR